MKKVNQYYNIISRPRRLLSVLAAGFFLAVALLFVSFSVRADQEQAKITSITGTVQIQRSGHTNWENAAVNMPVGQSDTVKTLSTSRVIVMFRGIEIRLGQNTSAVMEQLSNAAAPSRVRVQRGFGWFGVRPGSGGFTAVTPTAIASVRGTKFSLAVNESGTISCVCEGTVSTAASPGSQEASVSAGGSHSFRPDGTRETHNFSKYFKKLVMDPAFEAEIKADGRLANCKTCHSPVREASDREY